MAKTCPREPDAFLFAVGELGFWASLPLIAHLAMCGTCRAQARRLRTTAQQVAVTFASTPVVPLKIWAFRGAWLTVVAVGSMGLYVAGQRAVEAAFSTLNRPEVRQATYAEDEEAVQRNRRERSAQ